MNAVKNLQSGLSLIELMVTLAVVAIISTTAVPAMNRFVVSNDLRSAQEDVATVLRKAKNIARTQNTKIKVEFVAADTTGTPVHKKTEVRLVLPNGDILQTLTMNKVKSASTIAFTFDGFGTVAPLGSVNLTSERNTARSKTVTINSLFGQITLG